MDCIIDCQHPYHPPIDDDCYQVYRQQYGNPEVQGKIKRRSNRTKYQLHPCPSCQCPSHMMEHSLAFTKSDDLNIFKMLNEHERNVSAGLNHRSHSPTLKEYRHRPRRRQSAIPHKSRACHLDGSPSAVPLSPTQEDNEDSGSPDDDSFDNKQYEIYNQVSKSKSRNNRQCQEKRVEYDNDVKETSAPDPMQNRRPKKKGTSRNIRYSLLKYGSEVSSNKGPRGDAHCEITVKAQDDEMLNTHKTIFAGGDLDVHSMKNHILCLVDRALNDDFAPGLSPEQDKRSIKPIRIEITQVVQQHKNQTSTEHVQGNSELPDYEKRLKDSLRKRLSHIQDEIDEICKLEDLDLDSKGQSELPVLPDSNFTKSETDDRQQKTTKPLQRVFENPEATATS